VRVARSRRIIGFITLIALVAIFVGVTGFEMPLPKFGEGGGGATDRPVPGVRAVASNMLVRVGSGAPPGGQLAFLAVDQGGNLVVSDARRRTVMRFDASGHLLSEWGPQLGALTLDEPAGVAVQGDNFYVVDRGTPRIFRLDGSGRLQATMNLESLGTYGLNGLAVDPGGNIYAADTGRNRILVFTPNGQLLRQVGRGGTDLGGFTQPMMLAFGPDGGFFVADFENKRVERWNAAFEATDAWTTGSNSFGIAVDQFGRVFVPDADKRRILAFTPRGVALGEIGAPGSATIDLPPRQIALARSDRPSLYVLGNDGIQRVDLENTAAPPQGGPDIDLVSLGVIVLLVAIVVLAFASRRARRSLGSPLDGPVGLHAKDGGKGQHQETQTDQELLIANQPEREQ
jgi:sugar lactone lactonase YvrE